MFYVTMTDKFMSGWGLAKGRTAKLVIVCDDIAQACEIAAAARRRSEMRRVNVRSSRPSYPNAQVTFKNYADLSGPWKHSEDQ
jgi:hypothetical protein